MNKADLRQIIKEEIENIVAERSNLKEVSAYSFTDSPEYKTWLKQFLFIITDLNSRKIKRDEAVIRMEMVLKKFTGEVIDWAEGETHNEIGDMKDLYNQYKEPEAYAAE